MTTVLVSSIAGVLDNVLATLLISIYEFLYMPGNMIGVFAQYNSTIDNIYADKGGDFITPVFVTLKTVGVALLAASFLVSLMDKVSAGDFTINNFFSHVLKFVMLYMVLMNANTIFNDLLNIVTEAFSELEISADGVLANDAAITLEHAIMANSIHKHMGFGAKLGMFIMLTIPFAISVLYAVILNFFAISRIVEMTIRLAVSPVVAGLSYFGDGANLDFVRFAKRTLGLFFQVIVVLIIGASVTFVHNELVTTDETVKDLNTVVDPATRLVGSYDQEYTEIEVRHMSTTKSEDAAGNKTSKSTETGREWKKASKDISSKVTYAEEETDVAYKKEDFKYFIQHIVDPSTFILSTGIMLAALFMVFKSREISTRLFT